MRAAPTGRAMHRRRLLTGLAVIVLGFSLSGCRVLDVLRSYGCAVQDVMFPTDDRIIGGSWEGGATPVSGDPGVLAVALFLDGEFATERIYDVRGELVVEDDAPLRVDGLVTASCWERFVVVGAAATGSGGVVDPNEEVVDRASSPPPPSRFEARLIDATGVEVGAVSIDLDARSDDHRMMGQLSLLGREYTIDVAREPLDAARAAR